MNELLIRYYFALDYAHYPTGDGSSYFGKLSQYIIDFADRFDVILDTKEFLQLVAE
jgi:hypothetical protein